MVPPTVSLLTAAVKDVYVGTALAYSPMETMGQRIKTLRLAKGWSQQALADRVGVSREAVSMWENGLTKNIKNETFLVLLGELGTTYEYLMWGPGQRPQTGTSRKPHRAGGSGSKA